MTKQKNPLFSLLAKGSLGRVISYRRSRRQNIVETLPIPPDAKSLAQLSWRHMYLKAVALWHGLSVVERQDWESLARRKHMTGFAWFMSQALKPNPGLYLPLQGGTMSGNIDMAKNRLLRLPAPTDPQEAARLADLVFTTLFTSLTDTPAAYAGQALKGVRVNAGANALEFAALVGGYTEGCRVYNDAAISIPNTTETNLTFNTDIYDTDTMHSIVANTDRVYVKTAGKYIFIATIDWAANVTGIRILYIKDKIGETWARDTDHSLANFTFSQQCAFIADCAVNDYFTARVYQSSGGALNVNKLPYYSPYFMAQRIG